MAIHFHEGLPGAGKSYEACVFHILLALKAGRQVITNIRGINWEKFAELLNEPEEYVRMLLIYIEPAEQDGDASDIERVKDAFADQTPDNAMVVWDEVQDYFPSGNYKLPLNQQKFWTEHRHRGLEIIIMGQDRDDVHKIIRSRIEDIVYFLKLQAVGRPNQYKWEQLQKQSKGKFVKIGSGVRSYDPQYFGLYMSHRREGVKAGVYQTARTNVLVNSKALSWGVPFVFAGAIYAVYHLYTFFHPTSSAPSSSVVATVPAESPAMVNSYPAGLEPGPVKQASAQPQSDSKEPPAVPAVDYFDKVAMQYQVRASGIITSKKPGKEVLGQIEMLDSNMRVKEVFTVAEVIALGWNVHATGYGLLLEKQGAAHVARAWPIDPFGRVPGKQSEALRGRESEAREPGSAGQSSGTRLTIINSGKPGHLW